MGEHEHPPSSRKIGWILAFGLFFSSALAAGDGASVSLWEIVLLILLFALSAFFSASETAITTLWPWKVKELAEEEDGKGPFSLLEEDITRFLTTILVGNNLVNIAATALVTDLATKAFGDAGVGIATGVMTFLVLFFGEITPKSLAVHHADRIARVVIKPIYWLSILLYPIGRFFTWASTLILRALGLEPRNEPLVTEDELRLILAGAERSGAIEEAEEDMIQGVLELGETQVKEIMVPRVEIVAVQADASLREFLDLVREHRFSRYPIYEENIDHIIGIALIKDLLDYVDDGRLDEVRVRAIAHDAYFVPESMPVWNLLRELRRRKMHMAIVVDEFGGTAGLVTLEDVIEEIIGEIYDETDELEQDIKKLADGAYLIDAQTPLDDVAEALETEFPDGEYETLSGFLYDRFGYIPKEGEVTEHEGWRFLIAEADERKVTLVRAEPKPPEEEGHEEAD